MKKKLIIGMSALALFGAVAGGTYAFLTDAREADNVFTVGDVKIDLLSAVGDQELHLMPNNTDKTKVDYQIKNIGNEVAYVWLRVRVPAALEDDPGLAADNILHWNYLGAYMNGYQSTQKYIDSATALGYEAPVSIEKTWKHLDSVKETIDGVEYNVYDILYTGKLAAKDTTTVGISTIFIDERVDYIDTTDNDIDDGIWALVKDGGKTIEEIDYDLAGGANFAVEAHAIQANGFETVEDAYAAYNNQWSETDDGTKLTVNME